MGDPLRPSVGPEGPGASPQAATTSAEPEETTAAPALEMRGITKRYPGVVANDHIDLSVRPGEIHALLGENGAGKTTLMNVLYGLAKPDEGTILLGGKEVTISGPVDAIARGIDMVHQHFMLVPVLTVAENIILGEETMRGRVFLDAGESRRRIRELAQRFGFEIDPDAKVGQLPVGQQQRVEILKALYRDARILVLDEPTAVLTPQETTEIFAVLRRLAAEGHSIVFISHKLYEVLEIADRITVIRRGKVVGQRLPAETNEDDLAELMVGREVQLTVDRGESHPGDVRLRVVGLRAKDDRGHEAVRGVDLEVRAGEILGIAGVAGNGQDQLVEAIMGLRRPAAGTVHLDEQDITGKSPRALADAGVGYVPGDRQRFGLILNFPLTDNLVLNSYHRQPYSRGGLRDDEAIDDNARTLIGEFDIRAPTAEVAAATLSGGNQQKCIVAREYSRALRLLVLDQPTRGLDVGSIEFIHRRTIEERDRGTAILLVSAELDEVLELSDRVAVMYRGRIVAERDARTADKNEVGVLMATGGETREGAGASGHRDAAA
jgi:general nucleoside transport system ATP-binding protein